MLFQGKEFDEAIVKKDYEENLQRFVSCGMNAFSFEDWVEFNNEYYKNKKKAMDKFAKKVMK